MSTIKMLSSGVLSLEESGFTGGRTNRQGDGFVKMDIVPFRLTKCSEVTFCIEDNMSSEDGDYSPISLNVKQLRVLRHFIDQQIIYAETNFKADDGYENNQ